MSIGFKQPQVYVTDHVLLALSNSVSVPNEYIHLFLTFTEISNLAFVNAATETPDASANALLQSAANAPFTSYDEEFFEILGYNHLTTNSSKSANSISPSMQQYGFQNLTASVLDEIKVGPGLFEVTEPQHQEHL